MDSTLQTAKLPEYIPELNRNTLLLGFTGTGKTRYFLLPYILQTNNSLIVTESFHAELSSQCAKALLDKGYKIIPLDMRFKRIPDPFTYAESLDDFAAELIEGNFYQEADFRAKNRAFTLLTGIISILKEKSAHVCAQNIFEVLTEIKETTIHNDDAFLQLWVSSCKDESERKNSIESLIHILDPMRVEALSEKDSLPLPNELDYEALLTGKAAIFITENIKITMETCDTAQYQYYLSSVIKNLQKAQKETEQTQHITIILDEAKNKVSYYDNSPVVRALKLYLDNKQISTCVCAQSVIQLRNIEKALYKTIIDVVFLSTKMYLEDKTLFINLYIARKEAKFKDIEEKLSKAEKFLANADFNTQLVFTPENGLQLTQKASIEPFKEYLDKMSEHTKSSSTEDFIKY